MNIDKYIEAYKRANNVEGRIDIRDMIGFYYYGLRPERRTRKKLRVIERVLCQNADRMLGVD